MAVYKIPMREPIGRANPRRMYEFGDKVSKNLTKEQEEKVARYERSGKISGGKLGQPTLWAV